MSRNVQLDNEWHALMSLCTEEREYRTTERHPKVLRLISDQIDELASRMGFSPDQIRTREFRAVKNGRHIVRIIVD